MAGTGVAAGGVYVAASLSIIPGGQGAAAVVLVGVGAYQLGDLAWEHRRKIARAMTGAGKAVLETQVVAPLKISGEGLEQSGRLLGKGGELTQKAGRMVTTGGDAAGDAISRGGEALRDDVESFGRSVGGPASPLAKVAGQGVDVAGDVTGGVVRGGSWAVGKGTELGGEALETGGKAVEAGGKGLKAAGNFVKFWD